MVPVSASAVVCEWGKDEARDKVEKGGCGDCADPTGLGLLCKVLGGERMRLRAGWRPNGEYARWRGGESGVEMIGELKLRVAVASADTAAVAGSGWAGKVIGGGTHTAGSEAGPDVAEPSGLLGSPSEC